jgi:hypothetical protein
MTWKVSKHLQELFNQYFSDSCTLLLKCNLWGKQLTLVEFFNELKNEHGQEFIRTLSKETKHYKTFSLEEKKINDTLSVRSPTAGAAGCPPEIRRLSKEMHQQTDSLGADSKKEEKLSNPLWNDTMMKRWTQFPSWVGNKISGIGR